MPKLVMTVICVCVLAGTACADKVMHAEKIDDPSLGVVIGQLKSANCIYGNQNDPVYAVSDWIWGAEAYSHFVDPLAESCSCGEGFRIESLSLAVQFREADVPATFSAYVTLDEGIPVVGSKDLGYSCWIPGVEECVSDVLTFQVEEPGLYYLTVPIFEECACAYLDYGYFLSFHFVDAFPEDKRPDLVTDSMPVSCTSRSNFGAGWDDLIVDYGFPGMILVNAEVQCCSNPVPTIGSNWGGIKRLYR